MTLFWNSVLDLLRAPFVAFGVKVFFHRQGR